MVNLLGCDIHSANRIHPEWQRPEPGSAVRLALELALTVALVEFGTALVLRGGVPIGATAPPFDFSRAFVLRPEDDGAATRLLVRGRYRYIRPWPGIIVRPTRDLRLLCCHLPRGHG